MIVRDLTIRYRDSTTDTLIDYNNQRLILAPLLDFEIQIIERIAVVIEPLTGTVDYPDPNAFVLAIPTSWTAGNQFAITLLSQDWEQEGFAVGDMVFLFIKRNYQYVAVHAKIRQITANSASFYIIAATTGGLPTFQEPVEVVCFLLDDASTPYPALHTGSGSGYTSPLSGLAFTTPHADAFQITSATTNALQSMLYNLQKYAVYEADIDAAFLGLQPRRFREYTYRIRATQFYAYRTNLDPTAQAPTGGYSLEGRVLLDVRKRNIQRDISLSFDCLLLHPNRVEDTLTFLPPGVLLVTGSSATLTPPPGFTPARSRVALLGSDADHARQTLASSIALTAPTTPPSLPPARAGADYVGVMVGQSLGQWVAVMTNKVQPVVETGQFLVILPNQNSLYRYDSLIGILQKQLVAGTYIVQILIKYNSAFYVIDEYEFSTNNRVTAPYDPPAGYTYAFKSLLYAVWAVDGGTNTMLARNYDLIEVVKSGQKIMQLFLPLPSRRTPPRIPSAPVQPADGWAGALANWAGGAATFKWRVIAPDGDVYDSQEITLPTASISLNTDVRSALTTINQTASQITIQRPSASAPLSDVIHTIIRVCVFKMPEGYVPEAEKIYYQAENKTTVTILNSFVEGHASIDIIRNDFDFLAYTIIINKTAFSPGSYTIHVRHAVRQQTMGRVWVLIDDESYFYDFTIPSPPSPPPPGPPIQISLCSPRTPGVLNEPMPYLYRAASGGWAFSNATLTTCSIDNYCTCFELVPEIPQVYIDIIAYFRGSVQGTPVPAGAKHKARFVGRITRQDDEYTSESFVSSAYKEEDIIRTYAERYTLELLIFTSCELSHIDLMKHAEKWEVVNRSNHLLPSTITDLRPGEVSITNENDYMRVRVTLHALRWRSEYRRRG